MSRLPNLRRALQHIVVAALPVAASACCGGYQDPTEHHELVVPWDSKFAEKLAACLEDDRACLRLCTSIVSEYGYADPTQVTFTECRVYARAEGAEVHLTYYWPEGCVAGRRPEGLVSRGAVPAPSPLGAWLAEMAHLEAAAVVAFAALARDLARLGAPASLVRAALAAAGDEVRHAVVMARLARRHGVVPVRPEVSALPARDLAALAVDNAREGCVRELYGALVATWQARAAGDPLVRAAMEVIAVEETRHGELSLELDRWLRPRLDARARAAVDAAAATALAELSLQQAEPAPELRARAGLPTAAEARALAASLAALASRR